MDIESYEPRGTEVLEVEDGRALVSFETAVPSIGEAVRLIPADDERAGGRALYGWVQSLKGNRRAILALTGPSGAIEPGDGLEATGEPAALALPEGDVLDLGDSMLQPAGSGTFSLELDSPDFEALDGGRPALKVGHPVLDVVAPVCGRGMNLIVDAAPSPYDDPGSFENLVERVREVLDDDVTSIWIGEDATTSAPRWVDTVVRPADGDFGRIMALRAGVCLAAHHRDRGNNVLLVGELPAPTAGTHRLSDAETAAGVSMEELIAQLGAKAASTNNGAVTMLLRLPVGHIDGLGTIVETLGIGEVDGQVVLDAQGNVRPRRSSSRAELGEETREKQRDLLGKLQRAEQVREKRQIWGEIELSPEEKEVLEEAEELIAPL